MQWEADEQHGRAAKTPHEMFKWNQLGDLYAWFAATYAPLSLAKLKTVLRKNMDEIYAIIDCFPGKLCSIVKTNYITITKERFVMNSFFSISTFSMYRITADPI